MVAARGHLAAEAHPSSRSECVCREGRLEARGDQAGRRTAAAEWAEDHVRCHRVKERQAEEERIEEEGEGEPSILRHRELLAVQLELAERSSRSKDWAWLQLAQAGQRRSTRLLEVAVERKPAVERRKGSQRKREQQQRAVSKVHQYESTSAQLSELTAPYP